MIDLEKLKPILQEVIPEDSMADAVIRIQEIDEEMDNSALEDALAENAKLKEQNAKLTDIFFTGRQKDAEPDAPTPDEPTDDDEIAAETFEDLFEEDEYKKGETELNG